MDVVEESLVSIVTQGVNNPQYNEKTFIHDGFFSRDYDCFSINMGNRQVTVYAVDDGHNLEGYPLTAFEVEVTEHSDSATSTLTGFAQSCEDIINIINLSN